jgi:beta-mannosidase
MELGTTLKTDLPALKVTIPGSVQAGLKQGGILPDWNVGTQSRECEWVEHRHWEFMTEIPEGFFAPGKEIRLIAEGLDHHGWLLVDNKEIKEFCGTLTPHTFDLSAVLGDGKRHYLSLVFDAPPAEQGQIGYTSLSRHFKPRFNYSWDWCPRFVPIGIWDNLYFQVGTKVLEVERVRSELDEDNTTGQLKIILAGQCNEVTFRLSHQGQVVWEKQETVEADRQEFSYEDIPVEPWWPNGMGRQTLYDLEIVTREGVAAKYSLGFKRIVWQACEGAASEAIPWICVVNGKPVFLQGINWTPIRMDFAGVSEADYQHRIDLYREMGCNLLRVWGGAFLEKEWFYRLCDEAGLLVWQEFPLSSSGIDNWAPEDPTTIEHICEIARSYIRRRGHHVCKLLWCGGNELQHAEGKKTGDGIPLDFSHPCLRALKQVVEEEDPGVRIVPTSSSGPCFYANAKNFGKGIHHDVHGPWIMEGSLEEWKDYWRRDDALFRSEVGLTGTSCAELIKRYSGTCNFWPPNEENPYWCHANSWWIQYDRFKDQLQGLNEQEGLSRLVTLSQDLQARGLAIAAKSCKDRFPRCGGFIIWMGHDAFPCPSNTSIIDFEGNPKPAYHALKEVFKSKSHGKPVSRKDKVKEVLKSGI